MFGTTITSAKVITSAVVAGATASAAAGVAINSTTAKHCNIYRVVLRQEVCWIRSMKYKYSFIPGSG